MITEERLQWIRDNKEHGDIKAVVRELNPKNNKKGVTETEARSIINGNLVGKWGNAVVNALEKRIKARNKQKQRYANVA